MSRHYLDHASTSPARPEVIAAVAEWLAVAGDPGRVHHEGHLVRAAIEDARARVAALFGARSREVVFCSGATEAISAAIWGAAEHGGPIVYSAVEHAAVRESAARVGAIEIGADRVGRVDPAELAAHASGASLVVIQWANHEVGTIQPVAEVVAACQTLGTRVLVDAASAAGHVPIAFDETGADFLALSAHKLGGPTGVGVLLTKRGVRVRPLLVGGDQERARRAGLESTALIMGMAAAVDSLADGGLEREAARHLRFTERVATEAKRWPGVSLFGDPVDRVPHILCLGVDDVEAEAVVLGLDRAGIAVHSGSACSSEAFALSPVLEAMGVPADRSVRISTGWSTSEADIDALCTKAPAVIDDLRSLGGLDR